MIKLFFFSFLCWFLIGCCPSEDPEIVFEPKTIIDLTSELQGEIKDLTQIRLSFAKAVALAMADVQFRDYIKNISTENNDNSFNEIIFALHKNDKAIGNKSLETVINEAADDEIKAIYGNNFTSKILEIDPLVCIKIPDIFLKINWETEKFAPLVLAKTPIKFTDSSGIYQYVNYHDSGFQNFTKFGQKPQYFTIVVKYSEDYILLDKFSYRNEKGISIFDIVHQTENKWDLIKSDVLNAGLSTDINSNFIFIKKREIFNIHKNKIEPKIFNFIDVSNCQQICKRDCLPIGNISDNVLEKISFNPLLIDNDLNTDIIIEDNINLLFITGDFDNFFNLQLLIDKYTVTGFRKNEFIDRNTIISVNPRKEKYEKIGDVTLPFLSLDIDKSKYQKKEIILNHLIFKNWNGNEFFHTLSFYRYSQDDLIFKVTALDDKPLPMPLYISYLYSIGIGGINYCELPNTNYYFGIVDYYLKY